MQRRYPCTPEEREVCLLVLTADGYLKVLNADTGVVLKSVFLSSAINNQFRYRRREGEEGRRERDWDSTYPFRYLSWANYLYTIQVKTVQTLRPPPAARRPEGGLSSSSQPFTRLLIIAVFNILPLELLTCFSVDRHVCHKYTSALIIYFCSSIECAHDSVIIIFLHFTVFNHILILIFSWIWATKMKCSNC